MHSTRHTHSSALIGTDGPTPQLSHGTRPTADPVAFALTVFGFALLRLWIIYSNNLAPDTPGALGAGLNATVLVSGALTALALALAHPRPGILKMLACASFSLACPLMMAAQSSAPAWFAPIGLVAAGVATGASYMLFGLFFMALGTRAAIGAMAGTVVIASLVCAMLAAFAPAASELITWAVPVALVAILLELAHRVTPAGQGTASAPPARPAANASRLVRLLVALCANNVVIRMLDGVVYAQGRTGVTVFACFAAQFAVGAAVYTLFTLSQQPARRLALAYRCVLPVMAVGFLCLALWQSPANTVSMALIYCSHELFEIAFWVALVALAITAPRPQLVLGLGIGGVLVSMAAGQVVGRWLFAGDLASAAATLTLIALVSVVGLLMVTIVVLPESLMLSIVQNTDPDAGQHAGNEPRPTASESGGSSPDSARNAAVAALASDRGLTPRETDVFTLLACGFNVPAIMERLGISRGTANTHVASIYKKLDVHSQQDLVKLVGTSALTVASDRHD